MVITDLKMPLMDGISMTKYLRDLQKQTILKHDLKIILLTGGDDLQLSVDIEKGLFDKITFKPLDKKALHLIV
jgi:CheY-like chemotaxis protein